MEAYRMNIEEISKNLQTDLNKGLTSANAEAKLEQYGQNKLRGKENKTLFQRFIGQFKDVMILILLAAAAISFGVALSEQDASEFFEPALIIVIVVLNAVIGVFQENKAEKALEALKNLSSPKARVVRDGAEKIINSYELVPGDLIKLAAGDFVPADCRLISSANLKIDESALTGESESSEKDAAVEIKEDVPVADRTNMAFAGCGVSYGTGVAVVTATAMDTEIGKIAGLLENENERNTPLQYKLGRLGKTLGIVALAASAVVFVIGIINGMELLLIFTTAVSLAVSAIPEGLPAIVTVVLALGVQRMVRKNAIIRRLPAVETLGSASVICSDKTGTLTQNRMTLLKAYNSKTGSLEDISKNNSENVKKLLMFGTLCSDGSVSFEKGMEKHIGDPTETSIIVAAYKNGMTKESLNEKYPRLAELPFDSERKLMTTVNSFDGKKIVIVKGAYDSIAGICRNFDSAKASKINEEMSSNALRVLALAFKEIESVPEKMTPDIESDLEFLGLVGMIDPPRPEAKEAVSLCVAAGIKPVMITGDHILTAMAIGRELGIFHEGDKAISGTDLDKLDEEEFDEMIENISIYARVSPEDKIKIVYGWQRKGKVVAMTGDGVNDAPALKASDIGCAMGITGTDVAKGAADMVLTDDNFATIVEAVKEGRGIYANIRKVVAFLLGTNTGEILTVFFSMLIWRQAPLLPIHLLWINLITDSLPAIALGMENVEPNIMTFAPKPRSEGIFANYLGLRVVLQGIMFSILTISGFLIGENMTGTLEGGQTVAFLILALSQVVQSFNMRSDKSLFRIGFFTNRKLNGAALISTALIFLVLLTPLSVAFGFAALPPTLYLIGIGLAFVPLLIMELSKFFQGDGSSGKK